MAKVNNDKMINTILVIDLLVVLALVVYWLSTLGEMVLEWTVVSIVALVILSPLIRTWWRWVTDQDARSIAKSKNDFAIDDFIIEDL